ncbi:hypothetical protein HU200_009851 [Digitaria exilis]|uniref:DNA-directed RNA polymerase n=1 Tax=Digitaria exilis TaxID=1010633 RepID=A0A835KQD2_9POAL|nr:hypothetical protein HU200_060263 [Digitaria exilis]KAF8725867.1 hypothetical protein HU200_020431 [Digitaria exilis]KAF8737015.1 hypothetical protein HU200_014220 [Digitaria exilis]KAF8760627.1 hypothetical protein HU200_009914 [Digitaria exilis]KAF8760690.1 hypothetical protein HU200_009979 [Digitaria exilis]
MVREEVTGSTQTLEWKCVESRVDSKRLYYGRFILSPLRKGQADTVEGTCITRAKFGNVPHEYSTIVGPRYITAQDIILPPSVKIVDTAQPIANLREPIDFYIELQIKRDRGYHTELRKNSQDGSYLIDAVSMPVRNVNYSIFSCGNGNEQHEILFLEIWTNGSLTPKEALYEASRIPLNCIFIDQLELPSRTYNCLKRANIHTLLDLLSKTEEDLMRIDSFRMEDGKQIWDTLEKHLPIDLPKNKFSL